jgi:hypothetical protein
MAIHHGDKPQWGVKARIFAWGRGVCKGSWVVTFTGGGGSFLNQIIEGLSVERYAHFDAI